MVASATAEQAPGSGSDALPFTTDGTMPNAKAQGDTTLAPHRYEGEEGRGRSVASRAGTLPSAEALNHSLYAVGRPRKQGTRKSKGSESLQAGTLPRQLQEEVKNKQRNQRELGFLRILPRNWLG